MPTPCDSICFRNPRGDLLVSHSNRVSLIKLETYWTRVFDYYGVTDSTTDKSLFQVAADDVSLYSEAVIQVDENIKRLVDITQESIINQIINGKVPELKQDFVNEVIQNVLDVESVSFHISKTTSAINSQSEIKIADMQQNEM